MVVREESQEPTGAILAMVRRHGCMIILDIVIRITDKGEDAETDYFTFFFSLCLAIAVGLLIWINTSRGKRWLDEL